MKVDVAPEEFPILVRWKKRSDSLTLVRMKAEAVLYASEGVSSTVIAKMVERSERTIREWLADWRLYRMKSVVTGHAGNENAAKLTSLKPFCAKSFTSLRMLSTSRLRSLPRV